MGRLQNLVKNDRKVALFLFVVSLIIYSIYFHKIFLNLNALLSSITLDSIKNYYTFVYNIRHGGLSLEFKGMNYPFGEHAVYTDCQPLLSYILRLLPPLYPYSIGILHALLFLSFIITPVILYRVLRNWKVTAMPAFFFSLGLGLLSPQFLKINGGHHALAYGCLFPYAILLLQRFYINHSVRKLAGLVTFNTLIFFIHPYLGFCLCLFSFLTLFISTLLGEDRKKVRPYMETVLAGLFPIVFFKVFMILTDKHAGRPIEPFGSGVLVENIGSLLVPAFGPFQEFLGRWLPAPSEHFEGHSYLGAGTILILIFFGVLLPLIVQRKLFSKELVGLLIAAFIILFFSFGWHHDLLRLLKLEIPEIKQFRAVSRFAYVFYFCFPLILIVLICRVAESFNQRRAFDLLAVVFFGLSVWEGHFYFKLHEQAYWRFPNFFNEKLLNYSEQKGLSYVRRARAQCIMPLPLFHGGSEMYDRPGSSNSMIPSMLYSYHSGLPILSMMGSRTSIDETEKLIEVLNSYKKNNPLKTRFDNTNIVVIKTKDACLPDEDRLQHLVYFEKPIDSITIGKITPDKLFEPKISYQTADLADTSALKDKQIIFIERSDRKPFVQSSMDNYEKILMIPADQLSPGKYVVSLHYHYPKKIYSWLSTNLIIAEGEGESYHWTQNIPIRNLSGFYKGFGVFECFLEIKNGTRYELILKGLEGKDYHISHFLLRPEKTTTILKERNHLTINNFPQ